MALYLKNLGKKGRGVFTDKLIRKGEVIETCPVIPLSKEEIKIIRKTRLVHYWYSWSKDLRTGQCIVMGWGMIYNHSCKPNADFKSDMKNKNIIYFAIKDILPGEEITDDYGVRLWFKEHDENK